MTTAASRAIAVAPLNFAHKHYIPILKVKLGELWALERMKSSTRGHVTPLMEAFRATGVGSIAAAWSGPYFLDPKLLLGDQDAAAAFVAAEKSNALHIPAVAIQATKTRRKIVTAAAKSAKRGMLVRLLLEDFVEIKALEVSLDELMDWAGYSESGVDILIDLGWQSSSALIQLFMADSIGKLPRLGKWRTVSVAAGSFPESLRGIQPDQWEKLTREEWVGWKAALAACAKAGRKPSFGDYGIRDTRPPAEFGSPTANIRYTTNGTYLVRRGGTLVRNGGSTDIYPICASLVKRPEYDGPQYSQGDLEIQLRSNVQATGAGPGNAGNWVAWGMSHHFETAVDEIQNLP